MEKSQKTPNLTQLQVTKKQAAQLEALNDIWDSISTAEGLVRIRAILDHEKYWAYLNAVTEKKKLQLIVSDEEDDDEMGLSS